jgi:prepilin-type N-terminal cleavage/methylation domain-containing protein
MHTKQQSGFTLVELAVVVFLVGLLASLGLSALNAQLASSHISDTKKKQEIIKDALISYLGRNKRLPCPATNASGSIDGTESRLGGTPSPCTGNFGIIPYYELGLPKSAALDGYENFFSYAVSPQWTLTYSTNLTATSTSNTAISFNVGILGFLIVNDRTPLSTSPPLPISPNPAAIYIVSHGKNGLGAFTSKGTQNVTLGAGADETPNIPVAGTWSLPVAPGFYKREYNEIAATYFDDITLAINPNDLIIPLVKDGALKSAESQWINQVANINNSLIGYMISSGCTPPNASTFYNLLVNMGIPADNSLVNPITFTDPWGNTWKYNQTVSPNSTTLSSASPTNNITPPYTITAPIPNPNNITFNPSPPLRIQLFGGAYPNVNCP